MVPTPLIGGDRHIAQLADYLAGAIDFLMMNASVDVQQVLVHFDRHNYLFSARYYRAHANAVEGVSHLAGLGLDRGNGVAYHHAQVVLAMDLNDGFVDILHRWNSEVMMPPN